MTLSTLIIAFAVAGGLLTFLISQKVKQPKSWLISFLQNFCGVWFIFSGMVKAVDPMGTAFKMEQYFAAFQQTFEPTWMGFIAPVFPWMAQSAVTISILMIILEILVGVALIIGFKPKLTAWVFFLLLLFFTLLTGFTFLTGYVPSNANFFEFKAWGDFEPLQMRVSDCGCFGDFLKLDPKVSFLKDLGLLLPAIVFLVWTRLEHQLWTPFTRFLFIVLAGLGSWGFCHYNTYVNEPLWDFRAFRVGSDIASTRKAELEAAQQVQIEYAELKNKQTKAVTRISYGDYMKEFKKYPKEDWDTKFVYAESKVPKTKVSDYIILDTSGSDITQALLDEKGYSLMISAYKVHGQVQEVKTSVSDTAFSDSLVITGTDTLRFRVIKEVVHRESTLSSFTANAEEAALFRDQINPLVHGFLDKGVKVFAVTGGLGNSQMRDFAAQTGARYPIYQADDILLKTIMRSNPGLILWKQGKLIDKWHYRHLPSAEALERKMK